MNVWFTQNGLMQIGLYFAVLIALSWPLGMYIARVYTGKAMLAQWILGPVERLIYGVAGIDAAAEMRWRHYALHLISFSLFGFILLYLILSFQHLLPFNPQHFAGLDADLAFNTAVSFVTNTNWQSYGGEMVMSHFSQMAGLTVQNFLSAAVGMAVLAALVRGITRRESKTIGNFWVDLVRGLLYILLPLSLLLAVALQAEGVVQTLEGAKEVSLLQPIPANGELPAVTTQSIAVGPAASQIAIKQLGTNGGGFFNANSAHPLENPTPLSNFLQMLAILLIPAALCFAFGSIVGDRRQGIAIFTAMFLILVPFIAVTYTQEQHGNPLFSSEIKQRPHDDSTGGNMEGKETRFGIANSALWAATTTAASNGSVNSMHDSYTPLGGLAPMMLMQFGEVIFGGAGSGLYGMLVFVFITVFIAGLMVGRTPEYMGKKIQAYEIKMCGLVILLPAFAVLTGTAIAVLTEAGLAGPLNQGAHAFSEILYAFTSAGNNNGSAFAGLTADTPFYNTALGIAMLIGRFWVILPVLALAGSLAGKKAAPTTSGTLPTHTPLFVLVLIGIVIMVGVLTYVPALALGPIAEQLMLGE